MNEYIVSRTGWNKANQPSDSCQHTEPVARVTAETEEAACSLASKRVTVYNGQFLSAELATEVERREAAIDECVKAI